MYMEVSREGAYFYFILFFLTHLRYSALKIRVPVQIRPGNENIERYLHPFLFSQRRNWMFSWCFTILEDGVKSTKARI